MDLEDVAAICTHGKKQTNHHRALIQQLTKGMIPQSWLRYKVTTCRQFPLLTLPSPRFPPPAPWPPGSLTSLSGSSSSPRWPIVTFAVATVLTCSCQVSAAVHGSSASSLKTVTVWMGGLFNPEAFVTATRQCVAQVRGFSFYFCTTLVLYRPSSQSWSCS